MPRQVHQFDAVIFGGGIAGLWTLARLTQAGFHAVLIERTALGDGQSIASQGIIHGGIKYTLGLAEPGDASRQIAEMPGLWRACLEGAGEVDLRAARVLSPCQYLWTTPGLVSRVAGLGAARVIRTSVEKLDERRRPPEFAIGGGAPRGVDVYRVEEPVLDVASVLAAIAAPLADRIVRVNVTREGRFETGAGASPRGLIIGEHELRAQRWIFCAGEGNGVLLKMVSADLGGDMQLRPLHMAAVSGMPIALYGHCLGSAVSATPRITISSTPSPDGSWTWYIGGELAESGVGRSEREQVELAKRELRACVPWIAADHGRWMTLRINRAEGRTEESMRSRTPVRPDGPVVTEMHSMIWGWPTKLAFAPRFAAMVLEKMNAGVRPSGAQAIGLAMPRAETARYPWELGAEGAVR